ncbi:MAG TPA: phosphatase PAP2 family protein [Dehalococcoidia bacterium]|nr:phosphatase PAP2 family protein [Dehalococcoidia bacterium]
MSERCETFNSGLEWLGLALALAIGLLLVVRGRRNITRSALLEPVIIAVAYVTYFGVRSLTEGDVSDAFAHARDIVRLERDLGIYWEPDLQSLIVDRDCAVALANWVYIWWHWPVIAVAAIWLLLWHPYTYRRFRNAFLISGGIGLIVFALYPVAPPRLVADLDFVDTVTMHSRGYRVLQPPAFTNQYAAMPSLHFGWNLLIGLALVRYAPLVAAKAFGVVMPIAMFFAIVVTANHYILDPVAGAALALLGLALSSVLPPGRELWRRIGRRERAEEAVP